MLMNSAKKTHSQRKLLTCCVWKSTIPIIKNMSFCSCIFDCKIKHPSPETTKNMGVWSKGGKQESQSPLLAPWPWDPQAARLSIL